MCKARGLDPMKENIRTMKDLAMVDASLKSFEEFIHGNNNT